jgi:ubiquinone/menaquinone biosynthesis C-methylase UbiE
MSELAWQDNTPGASANPWYVSFFGEEYFAIYGSLLSDERTAREVDGIVKLLALPQGSRILDLACGHGRHAISLAERGYVVTGQDLSEVFLNRARTDAQTRGAAQVNWVHSDMRHIPFVDEFDAIINIFTAFGYLEATPRTSRCCTRYIRHSGRVAVSCWRPCTATRWYVASSPQL